MEIFLFILFWTIIIFSYLIIRVYLKKESQQNFLEYILMRLNYYQQNKVYWQNWRGLLFSIIIAFILLSFLILFGLDFLTRVPSLQPAPLFVVISILLGVMSATFAILARIEARGALNRADEIRETIGSFRSNFREIMHEMPIFIKDANYSLRMMIPTPFYGYLFQQKISATNFLEQFQNKLNQLQNPNSSFSKLDVILLNPIDLKTEKSQSHIYLQRSLAINTAHHNFFVQKTLTILNDLKAAAMAIEANTNLQHKSLKFKILDKYDPHVRLFVSDIENQEITDELQMGKTFIVFTETKVIGNGDDVPFKASGFRSFRAEMVDSLNMLFNLYEEDSTDVGIDSIDEIIEKFTTLE